METCAALRQTARGDWAPAREVAVWAAVAGLIAAVMLGGVGWLGGVFAANPYAGRSSLLFADQLGVGAWLRVFGRNLAVLGVHLGACWLGAIITRPYRPAPARWGRLGRLHRPLPLWMARMAMLYALAVTLTSVALQTTALGLIMADLAAWQQVSSWELTALVLPHAVFELVGVFLPLGLFLIVAVRGQTDRLAHLTWQACAISVPLVAFAAAVETWVTPHVLRGALGG